MKRFSGVVVAFAFLASMVLSGWGAAPASAAITCRTFPETGKTVCGRFLEYWNANGGLAQQGYPITDEFIEINPTDADPRGIADGDEVIVANDRGWCRLRAVVTDDVLAGVAISPKGRWASRSPGGRNVNWLTSDAVADLAEVAEQVCFG